MALILVLINLVGSIALLATVLMAWAGTRWLGWPGEWHQRAGLAAALLLLLGHSMTLFYFIGTGKRVRELVGEHSLDPEWVSRTALFKQVVFPWAFWGMLVVMAAFSLGGAVQVGRLPAAVHSGLALLALLVNAVALLREIFALAANGLLLHEVAGAIQDRTRGAAREEDDGDPAAPGI